MSRNISLKDVEWITTLRNEKNLGVIRQVLSIQTDMMLNSEEYNAGLMDKETYAKNVASTAELFEKILTDAKEDLDYLAKVEKEEYAAIKEKRGS